MTMTQPKRLLLGPQRPDVYLGKAMQRSGFGDGPIAVISAAWQEAEGDIDDIRSVVDNPLTDLPIYNRADALFSADEALQESYRNRQDQLQEQQRMYRLRLRQLTIAAREILRTEGNPTAIAEERRHAISQLRALDRHHLRQIRKINARFDDAFNTANNSLLADAVAEIHETLSRFDTVLITGGNVVVLLNRLRLFELDSLLMERNIVGWSAGAMVLCDRIVLFHDRMPQGRRDPEVMCEGLGIVSGTVLLPDAKGRLRQSETIRSSLFSRRFSPSTCLTLDNGAHLLLDGEKVVASEGVNHLSREGRFQQVRTA